MYSIGEVIFYGLNEEVWFVQGGTRQHIVTEKVKLNAREKYKDVPELINTSYSVTVT